MTFNEYVSESGDEQSQQDDNQGESSNNVSGFYDRKGNSLSGADWDYGSDDGEDLVVGGGGFFEE